MSKPDDLQPCIQLPAIPYQRVLLTGEPSTWGSANSRLHGRSDKPPQLPAVTHECETREMHVANRHFVHFEHLKCTHKDQRKHTTTEKERKDLLERNLANACSLEYASGAVHV